VDEKCVDKEQFYRWFKFGDVKGETGSTAVTVQTASRNKFWNKKLKVNADFVKNTKNY
jgi:hypothetical protein